jgi:predicted dehydrogenase
MTVRVGVAGLAGMGAFHLATIPKIDGYELTAICDVVPHALERTAAGIEGSVAQFADLGQMCRSGSVDAVVMAIPNWLHVAAIREALGDGVHVYCEKPLGVTVGECREIADLAHASGLRVQVGFQHRFQHGFASIKRIVDSGGIGALRRAEMRATDWFRPNSYFSQRPWRSRWDKAGGGVLMIQAIHPLDAFLWTCGMPSRVRAQAWRGRPDVEVEDDVSAILEFPGGATGILTASTLVPGGTNRIELHGDRGTIRAEMARARHGTWEVPTSTMLVERTNPFEPVIVSWADVEPAGDAMTFEECVVACHADFIDAITAGRDPLNNAVEATKSVEVANAVYLSALTGEAVDLPLDAAGYDVAFKRMCAGELALPQV